MERFRPININENFFTYLKKNTASLLISEMINTQILDSINQRSSKKVMCSSAKLLRMIYSHFENEDFIENFQIKKLTNFDIWNFSCFAGSPNSAVNVQWELHAVNGIIEFNDSYDFDICDFQEKVITMNKIDLKKINDDIQISIINENNGGYSIKTTLLNKKLSNYVVSNHISSWLQYAT